MVVSIYDYAILIVLEKDFNLSKVCYWAALDHVFFTVFILVIHEINIKVVKNSKI